MAADLPCDVIIGVTIVVVRWRALSVIFLTAQWLSLYLILLFRFSLDWFHLFVISQLIIFRELLQL